MVTDERGIGKNLKAILNQRGMTRKELAEKTGLTEVAIGRYINGEREPKAVTLSAIAMELGVSMDELMGTDSSSKDELDSAMRLVARNAGDLTPKEKAYLIGALVGA